MAKTISNFRPKTKTDYHVIEYRGARGWRPLPKLLYRTRHLAQAGLARLLDHRPEYASVLRVRPWMPDDELSKAA
jgi:hypothetical protein